MEVNKKKDRYKHRTKKLGRNKEITALQQRAMIVPDKLNKR
jgi:hypothetical protein